MPYDYDYEHMLEAQNLDEIIRNELLEKKRALRQKKAKRRLIIDLLAGAAMFIAIPFLVSIIAYAAM